MSYLRSALLLRSARADGSQASAHLAAVPELPAPLRQAALEHEVLTMYDVRDLAGAEALVQRVTQQGGSSVQEHFVREVARHRDAVAAHAAARAAPRWGRDEREPPAYECWPQKVMLMWTAVLLDLPDASPVAAAAEGMLRVALEVRDRVRQVVGAPGCLWL
jgi:hypothetical protein